MENDKEKYDRVEAMIKLIEESCYATDNNYAYKMDFYRKSPTNSNFKRVCGYSKGINFVPTYDKYCLFCDSKTATKRCSGCYHVYFCNAECQKKAWPIHKQHCKRSMFINCASCAKLLTEKIKCDGCPVNWCSEQCKARLIDVHKEKDCTNFSNLFPK
jgi:hypothetical protein